MEELPQEEEFDGTDTIHRIDEVERQQLNNLRKLDKLKRDVSNQKEETKPVNPIELSDHGTS